MNVAFIPARGGSKGIKLKNLQAVNGESILSRTIKAASEADKIDLVFVSSDSDEILTEAKLHGAIDIKRNEDLAKDETSTDPVIIDGLRFIEKNYGKVKNFILLQCTSTFTTAKEIDEVVNKLETNLDNHDAAFAVCESHSFIWNYDQKTKKSLGVNHDIYQPRQRRQDLEKKEYKELGSVYAIKKEALINSRSRFGFNPVPVKVSSYNSYIEIDSYQDLEVANILANRGYTNLSQLDFKMKKIKLLVMDYDGVFTNNLVATDQEGNEYTYCSKLDSLGLTLLKEIGIELLVITSEQNISVKKRLQKLNLQSIQTKEQKSIPLEDFIKTNKYKKEEVIYIGNDVNDLSVKNLVSMLICPLDGHPRIKSEADLITKCSGGRGSIREICDLIIKSKAN